MSPYFIPAMAASILNFVFYLQWRKKIEIGDVTGVVVATCMMFALFGVAVTLLAFLILDLCA